jgi:hypothetical protein
VGKRKKENVKQSARLLEKHNSASYATNQKKTH